MWRECFDTLDAAVLCGASVLVGVGVGVFAMMVRELRKKR